MVYDSIIIGAGPAGMTTALYLRRAGKTALVLEHEGIGGQIARSPRLENFPSIKEISGTDFSDQMFTQISDLGADFEPEDAKKIERLESGNFLVTTDFGAHEGKTVVLATGCKHRALGLPKEERLTGHGISYCATCDGAFFAGKEVLLIGDANTALQYAILLSDICKKVTIVTLFDHFFADDILVKKLLKIPNIEIHHNYSAKLFVGDEKLEGVVFESTETHEEKSFSCDGCFIAIGQIPQAEPFLEWVDEEKGFIRVDERMMTKTPGIYAVGDCRVKQFRQVVTATNDGAIAACAIANALNAK